MLLINEELRPNYMARAAAESILGVEAAIISEAEAEECVDAFLDRQARNDPYGGIGQRNRAQRRARARREQVNDAGNWVEAFDTQSGKKYWYNRLTRVSAWEPPSKQPDGTNGHLVRPTVTEYEGFRGFPGVKHVGPRGRQKAQGSCIALVVALLGGALVICGIGALLFLFWMLNVLPRQLPPAAAMIVGFAIALLHAGLVMCGLRSWVAAVFVLFGAWCVTCAVCFCFSPCRER
eukprot:SAG31_NODE_330_length_17593_cov_4.817891_29_plen_235_part_00